MDSSGTYVHPDGIIDPADSYSDIIRYERNWMLETRQFIEDYLASAPRGVRGTPAGFAESTYRGATKGYLQFLGHVLYNTDTTNGRTLGNRWVFTCKYGFIDLGHFFKSAFYADQYTGRWLAYGGSIAVEALQSLSLRFVNPGQGVLGGLDPDGQAGQSSGTFEDLNSNYYGAAFGTGTNTLGTISRKYRMFLKEAGAVTNLDDYVVPGVTARDLLWGNAARFLNDRQDQYTGERIFDRQRQIDYQKENISAFKCLCDGDKPVGKFRYQ